jgi:hypothetical protein
MARKVVNRKELRRENEAAERIEEEREERDDQEEQEEGESEESEKPAKVKAKKAPAKRKSRAAAKEVRLKAYWGVFNQSLKRVALFEHSERKLADKKAKELTESSKTTHFVQPVKEAISE